MNRPRDSMMEWEEADASSTIPRVKYTRWVQLWHYDTEDEFGDLTKETRKMGYDGELI